MDIVQVDDDNLDAISDFTEEYTPYLSNLETSYDICISIDFITERLDLVERSLSILNDPSDGIEEDDIEAHFNTLDADHCAYVLTIVLPKAIQFLCKTDVNNLYVNDIIQYQKTHQHETSKTGMECREFLVNKAGVFFENVISMILRMKPNAHPEFYDILKELFAFNQRIYKAHHLYFDRVPEELRLRIQSESSGKFAECNNITMKSQHPIYIKLINHFGSKKGLNLMLQEMLDGKESQNNKSKETPKDTKTSPTDDSDTNDGDEEQHRDGDDEDDDEEKETPQTQTPLDRPPSTMTHHSLQCYIHMMACMFRSFVPGIKQNIANYMFEAVEHWYNTMSIKTLKQYTRAQVHQILKKLMFMVNQISSPLRDEIGRKMENLRLDIAYRWLCTDSLERKITAWKEFKEFIDATQRKFEVNRGHKLTNDQLRNRTYCKNVKNVAIWHLEHREVAQCLYSKKVLDLFLAEDVHEELLKKSFDIMYFLGWNRLLEDDYVDMLWSHSIEKTESFVMTVYKVITDLFPALQWETIEHVINLLIDIPLDQYTAPIVMLIASVCDKCLYRSQLSTQQNNIAVPQKIAEWHCGLKLLWRAMQSERSHQESHIPVADTNIQQLAMSRLVQCLQSDAGAVHQFCIVTYSETLEYCKNLCVENLRCSRSVGTSLQVLQHIISAHPILPPPPPHNSDAQPTAKETTTTTTTISGTGTNTLDETKTKSDEHTEDTELAIDSIVGDEDHDNKENESGATNGKSTPTASYSHFSRESTQSEIIHSLEKHHGILTLFFQDLARYMNAYNPQTKGMAEHKEAEPGSGGNVGAPRQIVNFQARFDFLKFILQSSSLRLSSKQVDDLWNIVIGETLKSDRKRPAIFQVEQNYFFKWLKDICPLLNSQSQSASNCTSTISIDDAVDLFQTKLGSMPRKTMTSDSLQCLHTYFDLVYDLATKKSASVSVGVTAHPDLSSALDVMWEIAIEAETDTVAQSCGVFIISFYMKPVLHQNANQQAQQQQNANQTKSIENTVSDNIMSMLANAAGGALISQGTATGNSNGITAATTTTVAAGADVDDKKTSSSLNVNGSNNINTSSSTATKSKWEGRTNFVEKCMEYIQQQSISCNFRAVHRCLDLLETFIECTRPGVMKGELSDDSNTQNVTGFDEESSTDSVIYMGNNTTSGLKAAGNGVNALSASDFKKISPWELGQFAVKGWKLPIGSMHFITINVSNLSMSSETKNFKIMISKHSRVGELQDMIAAILGQDKGLLQMQSNNNVTLQPQIETSTLESVRLMDNCTVTVMSIFSLQNGDNGNGAVPDGAYILSQNQFYLDVLLDLLGTSHHAKDALLNGHHGGNHSLSGRLWNLLMRLPFNIQSVQSLKDIVSFVDRDDNGHRMATTEVDWNGYVDSTSTFKLLYSLQLFDSVVHHANRWWLEAFMALHGLQHLYRTLTHFQFDGTDDVFLCASYRSLFMLFKIFGSLTSHPLIEADSLFTKSMPRYQAPKILKIRIINDVVSRFDGREMDPLQLGTKIFELILDILKQIESQSDHLSPHHGGNRLLADIIELALYQLLALMSRYSPRLSGLFFVDLKDHEQSNQSTTTHREAKWLELVTQCLFCKDVLIRKSCGRMLYQMFIKFNPEPHLSQRLHRETLTLLFDEFERCKEDESLHWFCLDFFEFYGECIQFYCRNVVYDDAATYKQNMAYFRNSVLQSAWDSLREYDGLETSSTDRTDEYLLGLIKLMLHILLGYPALKRHSMDLLRDVKNHLIYECLFATPNMMADPIEILTATKRPPIPKCMTSSCRQASFNLLLCMSRDNPQIWNEILMDLQEQHDKRMNDVDIEFGFDPEYSRRSSTGLCGLHNYGCTCYMNATMQQLYCNPVIRKCVMGVDLRKLYEKDRKRTVFWALQDMFCNLKWSDRRRVWPEDFLNNYRDFEGNKIDPNEQMDAHEFFNFLFDNLEREVRGTIAEQILKNEFCGKEVNQVICQECGYVSETFVPMYAVSCKIKNHLTLQESLEQEFVRGDWLKGGNAYRCSKCDKKVTALKRSCFTQLPTTMLVHLQRFEFNLETMLKVKINSELRFSTTLNMKKYTKEYLDHQEHKTDGAELMEDGHYEYELVGITVHSGMADIGHYFSFIRRQYDDGTLGGWYSFNDDYVSVFDPSTIPDKCYGGNKLTLIRDAKTNQFVQRWIAKSNNAYILVYRRKSAIKKVENMLIDDEYLTLKTDLKELKANGNRPIEEEEEEVEMEQDKGTQIEAEEEEPKESVVAVDDDEATKGTEEVRHPLSPQESATEPSSSPKIMEIDETANPGESGDEPQGNNAKTEDTANIEPIIEEPDDAPISVSEHDENRDGDGDGDGNGNGDEQRDEEEEEVEPLRDSDLRPPRVVQNDDASSLVGDVSGSIGITVVEPSGVMMETTQSGNVIEIEQSLELGDDELNALFEEPDEVEDDDKDKHHLHDIAYDIHWSNTRFMQKCQICDMNLVDFERRFFEQQPNRRSSKLPANRHRSDDIRSSIGSPRSKLMIYFVWDILCKYEAAIKIPDDEGGTGNRFERLEQLKKLTPLYEWCQCLKQLFEDDVCSAYQFVYILTHSKRRWCRYPLESKSKLVQECMVDVMIAACKRLQHLERPLYGLRERDDLDTDDEDGIERKEDEEPLRLDRNKKDSKVPWFQSASVVVHLLDEMCKNILYATNYWRRFSSFWLFFKLFADLGNEEKQLLLDRHLVIECSRLVQNRRPFEHGLKQLVLDEDNAFMTRDYLSEHRVKYIKFKMGSDNQDPELNHMVAMLAEIICSCPPPTLRNIKEYDPLLSDYILPARTLRASVASPDTPFLIMPAADKRVLGDPKLWLTKFLEDGHNPDGLADIVCHLSWRNNEYSKKVCKQMVSFMEEYHENMYQYGFTVLSAFLALDDWKEDQELKIYAHSRVDRFLTSVLKVCRDWYRDSKYLQSVSKIARFIEQMAGSNSTVSSYFRIRCNEINVQWFQQYLSSHSHRRTSFQH